MTRAFVIGIVGAESSGKTQLARALHARLAAKGLGAALVGEALRDFCDERLRTPRQAEQAHRRCDLTLLTALDLPWQADGLQRDGAHVREPVDALIRSALQRMAQPFAVVAGSGDARLRSAWRAVRFALHLAHAEADVGAAWQRRCERCGEAACERHLPPAWLPRA